MTTATQRIIKSKGGEITVRDFLGLLTRGDARYLRTSRLDEIQTTTVDMSGSVEGYLMPKHSIKPSLVFPCYFENKSQAQEGMTKLIEGVKEFSNKEFEKIIKTLPND